MLYHVYLLTFAEDRRPCLIRTGVKAFQRTLLVPRSLCVFETLPCKGLSWNERRNFARMQAERLQPFTRSGCSAAIHGDSLCLWFWDAEEVGQALEALNWQPRNLRFSVESLYLEKPLGDGEVIRPCAAGAELWTLRHGIVQSSRWQMTAIEAPHPLRRAWASDLRPLDTRSNANLVQLVGAKTQRLLTWTPTTVLWLSLAWLAYHGAYWLGARQRLTILEAEAALADQRISSMASLGSEAKKDDEWLVQYKTFAASVPFDYVLEALRPALEHSGVVIKELELRGDQLRIQVTTAGGEIDLPALLKRLEAIHGFADVELREHTELTGATFGMKTTALKRLILPTSQKP